MIPLIGIFTLLFIGWICSTNRKAVIAGNFLGQKLVLNEFVAFSALSEVRSTLTPNTLAIITMALCGFANLSAPAAMIGVLGTIIPGKNPSLHQWG